MESKKTTGSNLLGKFTKAAVFLAASTLGSQAYALATAVQLDPAGGGDGTDTGYAITDIVKFDWSASGDLVIIDSSATGFVDGTAVDGSFATWLAAATDDFLFDFTNDSYTVTYDLEAHTRLSDLIDGDGDSVADTVTTAGALDLNGTKNGDAGYEITAALEATETATLLFSFDAEGDLIQTLTFNTLSGTYAYYLDVTPDSDVNLGTGFMDGVVIVSGDIVGVSGTAEFDTGSSSGNADFSGDNVLTNTVTFYDMDYIQTDPAANQPLSGTTFDTLINLQGTLEAAASDVGEKIGTRIIVAGDLVFKADANTLFESSPVTVPSPQTLFLFGIGLLGMGLTTRRRDAV